MLPRALALLVVLAAAAHAADRREALLLANCPREAGEYVGTYRGRVLLHRALLAAYPDEDAAIRRSIEHQLRYLWGHYRNDAAAHAALQVSLGAEGTEVRVLSRREVPYGRDLELGYGERAERLKLEEPYQIRAVARGRVGRADPALLVEYELRFRLAICGRGEDAGARVRVPLPPDPWLAYWYVPQRLHRPLRYHGERATTNPCADDDFADLPHPYYYWYDWLPTRHGPDDDGRAFDCRAWLQEGTDYDRYDVDLTRVSAPTHDFRRLREQLAGGPLTATIVIGVVDHAVTKLELPTFRELLGEAARGELPARARAALARWATMPPREPGTRAFLEVLAQLEEVMAPERHAARVEGGYLGVEVTGRLRQSGRPLRVRLWLGLTDVFGPTPPAHWRILRRALVEDQLVVYWGHSGIGENFRLAQIERHLGVSHEQMSADLRAAPLRLVAFLSCYSYMYFGQDLLAAGAEREDGGYFVFTGMESARHEAGPLAVLELVDRILRPDNPEGRVDAMPRLGDDEFWLVKEVRKGPREGR